MQKLALMYFNTSNVTIQQKLVYHEVISLLYFNTSNVTIQPLCSRQSLIAGNISIHLMLLFNKPITRLKLLQIHFNTSNVTIQRFHFHFICKCSFISIHLMLLFNAIVSSTRYYLLLFQYI